MEPLERVYKDGENLLKRDDSVDKLNQKSVSDITYIHTIKDGGIFI